MSRFIIGRFSLEKRGFVCAIFLARNRRSQPSHHPSHCCGGGGETRRKTRVDASYSILLNNRLKHEGYMGASISGLNYVIYVEKIGQNRCGAL